MTNTDEMPNRPTLNELMKSYERAHASKLTPKSYAIIRVDGKSFHNYTRHLGKPYDEQFMADMDSVAVRLCQDIPNARLGYVQSDEISVLLTDWSTEHDRDTKMWFDGKIQKMVSVSASMASTMLNIARPPVSFEKAALFDSRVFNLPDFETVEKYFMWRYLDAKKNSVSMAAHNMFSPKQVDGLTTQERVELCASKGVDWNTFPAGFKNGRVVLQKSEPGSTSYVNKRTNEEHTAQYDRKFWEAEPAEGLLERLSSLIPQKA